MMSHGRKMKVVMVLVLLGGGSCTDLARLEAEDVVGQVTIPIVTGQPGRQAFMGHSGWVDVYGEGRGPGVGARIQRDGTFTLPSPAAAGALVATFDKMEIPPIILSNWPGDHGHWDIDLQPEYACVPSGYPEAWKQEYMVRGANFWQTFVARCSQLYGCCVFDGPKIVWWGNKINVSVHADGAHGAPVMIKDSDGGEYDAVSAGHSDFELPRIGWRHGDVKLVPGRKYAIRVGGYRPHGGNQLELDAFVRPDKGDGYAPGEVINHRTRTGGDLCFLLFGNGNGQIVENQIRSEEWELFIPRREPAADWGQTFVSHGVSLAGVCFWGSNGSSKPVECEVIVREGGPEGRQVGPTKVAHAHESPDRPIIRYPEIPGELPGYGEYYKLPADLFQVAYRADECPLEPGKTYYIGLRPNQPLMMYADGEFYQGGFAYCRGAKQEKLPQHDTFHSRRWTLAMSIVTYENPKGAPSPFLAPKSRPKPGPDGNLIVNGGAETGDFSWWEVGSDPIIDPSTHVADPANHSGIHRFGISVGWNVANMYQYQEVPGLTPGQTYVAGMWVHHGDGTDEKAELLWIDGRFGGEERLLGETMEKATSTWRLIEGKPFKPTQSTVTLVIRYRHPKATNIASIHIDDIYLKQVQ